MLRKRVQAAGLDISVTNRAINSLDDQVDLVITHKGSHRPCPSPCAACTAHSLTNFLDNAPIRELVQNLSLANDDVANPQFAGGGQRQPEPRKSSPPRMHLGPAPKEAAIVTPLLAPGGT